MEGNGEGMVAIVTGLEDAGLAVTLMSRRYKDQGRRLAKITAIKRQSLPQISPANRAYPNYDSVLTNNAGVQICDDRYASSYQLAHCSVRPTSPPVSLTEFPPQRTQPCRTQGNFEIGGLGSGEVGPGSITAPYAFRNSLSWSRRGAPYSHLSPAAAACQTDSFALSLRRYPGFPPTRSISADLIEKLIKHTQRKNLSKTSKFSKGVRSKLKQKQSSQTYNHEDKRSKHIQTYTRTKLENSADNDADSDGKFVRTTRAPPSTRNRRNRKNKVNPISFAYDYLNGHSSVCRSGYDRIADVRYLDNLSTYIKDALQQICDDKPTMCPKIQSRYDRHRQCCHRDMSSNELNHTNNEVVPSTSRGSTLAEVSPGICKPSCPRGRKTCEYCHKALACSCIPQSQPHSLTSPLSLSMESKFCQCQPNRYYSATPEGRQPEYKKSCICIQSEDSTDYGKQVDEEVAIWIKELPVYFNDTPEKVTEREKLGKDLARFLKKIPRDENFNDNVINEVKNCLNSLSIWLPEGSSEQESFKDKMALNFLDRLKKIHGISDIPNYISSSKETDIFVNIIKKWVNDINFLNDANIQPIINNFIKKLKPITLNRPDNDFDYTEKLRAAIIEELEELPIEIKEGKIAELNRLTNKLIDMLVPLPKNIFKTANKRDTLQEIMQKINDWLDEENEFASYASFKNSKDVNDLAKKIYDIQSSANNENLENDVRNAIRDFLNNIMDIKNSDAIRKLIDNLLRKLFMDKIVQQSKDREEYVDRINQIIYNWLKELPEISNIDLEKLKEYSKELAKNIFDNISAGKKPINIADWLERKLSDIKETIKLSDIEEIKSLTESRKQSRDLVAEQQAISIGNTETEEKKIFIQSLVLKEIDHFLDEAITEFSPQIRAELKENIAEVVLNNVDKILANTIEENELSDETDKVIDNLLDNVKKIFLGYYSDNEVNPKLPNTTKYALQEEIGHIFLDNSKFNIKNKDVLKSNLVNSLIDGIIRQENDNQIENDIYNLLREANLPLEDSQNIARKLVAKAKEITLILKSQDSQMLHKARLSKNKISKVNDDEGNNQKGFFILDDKLKLDNKIKASSMPDVDATQFPQTLENINGNKDRKSIVTDSIYLGPFDLKMKGTDNDFIKQIPDTSKNKSTRYKEPLSTDLIGHIKRSSINNEENATQLFKKVLKESELESGIPDKSKPGIYTKLSKEPKLSEGVKDISSEYKSLPNPSMTKAVKKELIETTVNDKPKYEFEQGKDALVQGEFKHQEPKRTLKKLELRKSGIRDQINQQDKDISQQGHMKKIKTDTQISPPDGVLRGSLISSDASTVKSEHTRRTSDDTKPILKELLNLIRNKDIEISDVKELESRLIEELHDRIISESFNEKVIKKGDEICKKNISGEDVLQKGIPKYKSPTNTHLYESKSRRPVTSANSKTRNRISKVSDKTKHKGKGVRPFGGTSPDKIHINNINNKIATKQCKEEIVKTSPMSSKTIQEIKKILKNNIHDILDKANIEIVDQEDLETNLLNTVLSNILEENIDAARNNIYNILRHDACMPESLVTNITKSILREAIDISQMVGQNEISCDDHNVDTQPDNALLGNNLRLGKTFEQKKQRPKVSEHKRKQTESDYDLKTTYDFSNADNTIRIKDQITDSDSSIAAEPNKLKRKTQDSYAQKEGQHYKTVDNNILGINRISKKRRKGRKSDTSDDKAICSPNIDLTTSDSSSQVEELPKSLSEDINNIIDKVPLALSAQTKEALKNKLDTIIKDLKPPYSNEDVDKIMSNILSNNTLQIENSEKKSKAIYRPKDMPQFSTTNYRKLLIGETQLTGKTKVRHQKIRQEINNILDNILMKFPRHIRNHLKNKIVDIILTTKISDIDNNRNKIKDVLMRENHLIESDINDLSNAIVDNVIDKMNDFDVSNRKKFIYSLQIRGNQSKLHNDNLKYLDNGNIRGEKWTKRKRTKNSSLDDRDNPLSRSKTVLDKNTTNLKKCISEYIDETVANNEFNIPINKIVEIKSRLDALTPKDIEGLIRRNNNVINKLLSNLNELGINENDANKLIYGLIDGFQMIHNDSESSFATSSQVKDMKGYLKGEIQALLNKYNVKFGQGRISRTSVSTSPSLKTPVSSTPKNGAPFPQLLIRTSLSSVYDQDNDQSFNNTVIPTSRINSDEYLTKVLEIVDNWVEKLPADIKGDNPFKKELIKNLVGDIYERQKYLQLNPEANVSKREELECLKYQVFKRINLGDITPIISKIEELNNILYEIDVPLLSKSPKIQTGVQKSPINLVKKYKDWIESLPLQFNSDGERDEFKKLQSELLTQLQELSPNASSEAIKNKIDKFLHKFPLDPSRKCDLDEKINELTKIFQTSDHNLSSFGSKMSPNKVSNYLYDFIENWCENLPFDESLDKDTIKNIYHGLANKILQKICQLNLNSEIFNDEFLYEDVLRDEIDNLISDIRNYIPVDDYLLANIKDVLVDKVKKAKQKTQNELAGQMYKQQLRDAISKILPPNLDLTNEDQTSFEILKDVVADAFINLNYSFGNEELKYKMKKKIADEVTKFCNNYLKRHPLTPICSNKLNQNLYVALKNVSLPNENSMRSEVEHVRIKDIIIDWVRRLPLSEQTPTGQLTLNKMVSILAKRLHDFEMAKEYDSADNSEEMKKEIKKWLKKLPLVGGIDAIDHYAEDLLEELKSTEIFRKFDASMKYISDATEFCPGTCRYVTKEKTKPKPKPLCPDTCPPNIPQPSSSLTNEDREHLNRIRERVQQATLKLPKHGRDAAVSPCDENSSQTDMRFESMKTVPSEDPRKFQMPYRSLSGRLRESPSCQIPCSAPRLEKSVYPGTYAPPCQQRRIGESPCIDSFGPYNRSYEEVEPQVIIKEYYWDSNSNSNHQMPGSLPYEYYPGPQNARPPCSQPSPGPSQHAQSYTKNSANQSPQMSTSGHESKRPNTSRYYKERVTRLGSLDDIRGSNLKTKASENFEWSSVRFPEDDDFWGPCPRSLIVSDDDFGPFTREREKNEERVKCRCRERVLSRSGTKRKNRQSDGSCFSCNNDPNRNCSRCCAQRCPYPSYLYFRK